MTSLTIAHYRTRECFESKYGQRLTRFSSLTARSSTPSTAILTWKMTFDNDTKHDFLPYYHLEIPKNTVIFGRKEPFRNTQITPSACAGPAYTLHCFCCSETYKNSQSAGAPRNQDKALCFTLKLHHCESMLQTTER